MENGTKRPRRPVKAKANGMWKKVRYAIVILFALVLVQQVYTIYSLHQEKQQLEQQLQELKIENESLSEQKKSFLSTHIAKLQYHRLDGTTV